MHHSPAAYFDLSRAPGSAQIDPELPAWEAIKAIALTLDSLDWDDEGGISESAVIGENAHIGQRVRIGSGSRVAPGVTILGPAWIGENCDIRSGAYLRENVIVGNGAVLGNSCEFKNCILFDEVEAPHFNYVGDSILGYRAHLGAGVILSNVRLDRQSIRVPEAPGARPSIDTGLRKFGAIVGDETEIGCNSVISPGSLLGKSCVLYPGVQWRGALASNMIVKLVQEQVVVKRSTL